MVSRLFFYILFIFVFSHLRRKNAVWEGIMASMKVRRYSVCETFLKYAISKQRRKMIMVAVGFFDLIVKWIIGF